MIGQKILVVAPHPDDEILGCGGTLARFRRENPAAPIDWVVVTEMRTEWGYTPERIAQRRAEIQAVADRLSPLRVHSLGFQSARLDTRPLQELVEALGRIVRASEPDTLLLPWRHDVHSDHRAVFDAGIACSKSFRYPSVRTVLAYETPSETDFALDPGTLPFRPNLWVDITRDLPTKVALLNCYPSEIGPAPFPRSDQAVESLARVRGSAIGVLAAEAFVVLKARV